MHETQLAYVSQILSNSSLRSLIDMFLIKEMDNYSSPVWEVHATSWKVVLGGFQVVYSSFWVASGGFSSFYFYQLQNEPTVRWTIWQYDMT